MARLSFSDHTRNFKDFIYVYPVVSRRSQGVSLGINLNINNACNWRCVYCQVDGLIRGKPDTIDLVKLEAELDEMLSWIIDGDFLSKHAPSGLQRFNDIALSGNGESTLSKEFLKIVAIIAKLRKKYKIGTEVKTILITNGSEIDKSDIQDALILMAQNNGEVWFKVDSCTETGINQINQVSLSLEGVKQRLKLCCSLCNTYIQTCMFKFNNKLPSETEINKYLNFVNEVKDDIKGVLLYSIARTPGLIEYRPLIEQLDESFLSQVASQISNLGIMVKYYK